MNEFRTKLLVGLFVPALALGTSVASAAGDTKVMGQSATSEARTRTTRALRRLATLRA